MKRVTVREGNTGILKIRDEDGREEVFVPNCDYGPARYLLLEFQELLSADGTRLKDCYRADGTNWFPAAFAHVYGRIFTSYVRYRPLAEAVLDGSLQVSIDEHTDLRETAGAAARNEPQWELERARARWSRGGQQPARGASRPRADPVFSLYP